MNLTPSINHRYTMWELEEKGDEHVVSFDSSLPLNPREPSTPPNIWVPYIFARLIFVSSLVQDPCDSIQVSGTWVLHVCLCDTTSFQPCFLPKFHHKWNNGWISWWTKWYKKSVTNISWMNQERGEKYLCVSQLYNRACLHACPHLLLFHFFQYSLSVRNIFS